MKEGDGNEAARLAALAAYNILDTPAEAEFDELTQLAAQLCQTPIALLTLLDDRRQWFKSKVGLDVSETPKVISFCRHAIQGETPFIVEDALLDERFAHNPLVQGEPYIRFYAGVPLTVPSGHRLGTLCVIAPTPQQLTDEQLQLLQFLSHQVVRQLELRRTNAALSDSEANLRLHIAQQAAIARLSQLALITQDINALMNACVKELADVLNVEYSKVLEHQPEQGNLLLRAGIGWRSGLVGQATVEDKARSQAGYTLVSSEPIVVEVLNEETRFSGPQLLIEHGVASGISVLISGKLRPFGVVGIHSCHHRTFSQDDVNFVQSVANILANAIEKRQTETMLSQSESRFRSLVDTAPVGIFLTDVTGQCQFVNERWQQMTGLSSSAAAGDGWAEALHPDDRERIWAEWATATENNQEFASEYRFLTPQRGTVWVTGRALALSNSLGAVTGYLGTVTDVSDRKAAELSLQHSEAVLRSFFENAPIMLGVVELQGEEIVHLSDSTLAASFLNRKPADMQNQRASDMGVPREVIQMWIDYYQQAASTGRPVDFEYQHPGAAQPTWLSATVASLKKDGESSQPPRFAYLVEDITERKQTEAKLQEQAALLDVTTDAILVRDTEGRILFWNKGAEALYGWSTEEAIGQLANPILYAAGDYPEADVYRSLEKTGRWQGERQQRTRSGKSIIVMSRWAAMLDKQGQLTAIMTVNTDITGTKAIEEQFLRAQRLESLGTLASGIAHDLNNILTPIYGVAQLLPLELPEADEAIQQQFEILKESAERGAGIIRQVLSFSRGADGERAPVNIKHPIAEIKRFVQKTFPKSIDISLDIPKDLKMVMGDMTQLHQIFMNLFVNARDAMPDGGKLTLSATNLDIDDDFAATRIEAQPGAYILVTVADTGVGISPEQLDHIFEPFFTTKQTKGGTGLGLSTVHGLVKKHGGFITAYSEVGNGTQFNVYLPAIKGQAKSDEGAKASPRGEGEYILVVDDEAPIRQVTGSILESYGYRVRLAKDGTEAIAQYAQSQAQNSLDGAAKDGIQLVLMDMMMPGLSGAQTIQVLQEIDPTIKVIAVSGLPNNHALATSTGESVKVFMQKPYSPSLLLEKVRDVLKNGRANA